MAEFMLGNFSVKEVIAGVAKDFDGNFLYHLDQLTNASISITSDSTDVTDKNGNIIRTIYRSKQGELSATSALLSPALLNANSGSPMEIATALNTIVMPNLIYVQAGATVDVSEAKEGTIHVMGLYTNGANGKEIVQGTEAVVDSTYALVDNNLTVPAFAPGAPNKYLVMYDYDAASGYKMTNYSNVFPDTIQLYLACAIMDPCDDQYRLGIVRLGNFQPSPEVTINLDSENTETDYNGRINVDYCSEDGNVELYSIFFPDKMAVTTAIAG